MRTEKRKNYTAEFKCAAVGLVTEQGYSRSQASRRLDINVNMLRRWKHQFEKQGNDSFSGKAHLMPEQEELNRLRQENQRLRMERDMDRPEYCQPAARFYWASVLGQGLCCLYGWCQ